MASLSTSTPIAHRDSTPKPDFAASNISDNAKQQSIIELICEAIDIVGAGRKGASYIAIKKYVLNKRGDPESSRLKTSIKKNLVKALEEGRLLRPISSKNAKGATGHFVLPKKDSKTAAKDSKTTAKDIKKSKIRKQVSDSEATVQKSKVKKKLNLSDSALQDIAGKTEKPKILVKNIKKNKLDKIAPVKKAKDVPAKKDAAKKPKEAKMDEVVPTKGAAAKKPKVAKIEEVVRTKRDAVKKSKEAETAKDDAAKVAVVKEKLRGENLKKNRQGKEKYS